MYEPGRRGLFYHKSGVREKSLSGEGGRRSELVTMRFGESASASH